MIGLKNAKAVADHADAVPKPIHEEEHPSPPTSPSNPNDRRYERSIARWTFVVGLFTALLFVATGVSAYFLWATDVTLTHTLAETKKSADAARDFAAAAVTQADATKQSADIAARSLLMAQSTQRASVSVARILSDPVLSNPTDNQVVGWTFSVEWQNKGPTRARNFRAWYQMKHFEPDIPDDFDYSRNDASQIPVTLESNSPLRSGEGRILNAALDLVAQGRGKIYMWGQATYDDIFEGVTPERHTAFCVRVDIKGDIRNRSVPPFVYVHHTEKCNYAD